MFIAVDDSITLDSDLGVKLGGLVITTPLLKDLILPSERGQDITKLADLLTDQARHRFFAMFAPPLLIPIQRVECEQVRRSRIFGQRDKLKANRSKGA